MKFLFASIFNRPVFTLQPPSFQRFTRYCSTEHKIGFRACSAETDAEKGVWTSNLVNVGRCFWQKSIRQVNFVKRCVNFLSIQIILRVRVGICAAPVLVAVLQHNSPYNTVEVCIEWKILMWTAGSTKNSNGTDPHSVFLGRTVARSEHWTIPLQTWLRQEPYFPIIIVPRVMWSSIFSNRNPP